MGYARLVPLCFLLITLGIFLADYLVVAKGMEAPLSMEVLFPFFVYGKYIGPVLTILSIIFVELFARLTVFTTISMFGVVIGTGALITTSSLLTAMYKDIHQRLLGDQAHMTIKPKGKGYIEQYQELLKRLEKTNLVLAASPYLETEIITRNLRWRFILCGVDPDALAKATEIDEQMTLGSLKNLYKPGMTLSELKGKSSEQESQISTKLPGVVIGKQLALDLSRGEGELISLGSEIDLLAPFPEITPMGTVPTRLRVRVVGIFDTGNYEQDANYIYMRLADVQKIMQVDDVIGGIDVKLNVFESNPLYEQRLKNAMNEGGPEPQYQLDDWKPKNHVMLEMMDMQRWGMFVMLGMILLVATSGLVAQGKMLFAEKTSEIAILKTLGMTDGDVLLIFTLLGSFVGFVGTAMGVLLAVVFCQLLSWYGLPMLEGVFYITQWPILISIKEIMLLFGFVQVLVLFAMLPTAKNAATLRPVDGLR